MTNKARQRLINIFVITAIAGMLLSTIGGGLLVLF